MGERGERMWDCGCLAGLEGLVLLVLFCYNR